MTSTCNALAGALACVMKIVLTVGTAMTARMTAGITVHRISSVVLPCTCFGSGEFGRALNLKMM